jgi:phenylalanyl-tRNA synthetase alpha chain
MQEKLLNLKNEAIALIIQSEDKQELERLRIHYLGKKGIINELAKDIPQLPLDKRVEAGQVFNDVKEAITNAINAKAHRAKAIKSAPIDDLHLPGTEIAVGILHPLTAVAQEMNDIFKYLGFSIADGPEIETEEYCFERLNLPPDHPGRDLQDSLYIRDPDIVLRTHTSSVEAHILANHKPPYRFVFPGKAYRYENVSSTNHMMFNQYQGVAVGENITLGNLKWTLETFIKKFYGEHRQARFRCKYYPEVEPGMGVDIDCPFCDGLGCQVCKYRGWIEILGSGMIHPNMLKRVDLDPSKYSGFAWGMGLDRITMTRYGLKDIRSLFNGDLIYKI